MVGEENVILATKQSSASTVLRVLFIGCLMALSIAANSAYLKNRPITITQPDGAVQQFLVSGDEYYNWIHDPQGYVIVQDPDTGWYVYAQLIDEEIKPTIYVAGSVDPAFVGLVPNIRPPVVKLEQLRATLFSNPLNTGPQSAPQTGTINNIVIFIRFSDDTEFTQTISAYDSLFNSTTTGTNSMRNYFLEASYNLLTVSSTFYPTSTTTVVSYQDTNPRSYYLPYNATTNPNGYTDLTRTTREHTLVANAVNGVKSQIPTGLNVDADSDGYVDNICFVVKGSTGDWNTILWPHEWQLYSQMVYINSKQVFNYNIQFSSWLAPGGVGVLSHEMMHSLGAPDLYHYNGGAVDPVGDWDAMSNPAEPPQHPCAYTKFMYLGWISSIPQITTPGTYSLNPLVSSTNNCYKIAANGTTTEYYVLEYRRKTGLYESSVPGSGLVAYRINTVTAGNAYGPPDEIYVYRPGGTTTVNGTLSSAFFNSTVGRTAFNSATDPTPFLSNGTQGGLYLSNIGAAGSTISFTVSFKLPTPTISPAGGSYTAPQMVTLSVPGGTGNVYYTTNGADPDQNSPYVASGGSITISSSCTLKAKAMYTGYIASDIQTASYTVINMSIPDIKMHQDGATVGINDAIVSARFADGFYIEADGRYSGIYVSAPGHSLTVGMRARVMGTVQTDATTMERYVAATSTPTQNGTGTVSPLGMPNKLVGGGNWNWVWQNNITKSGQRGATGKSTLNNVGLLLRLVGTIRYIDSGTFAVGGWYAPEIICKMPAGVSVPANLGLTIVTGVCSLMQSGSSYVAFLKIRDLNDIKSTNGARLSGAVTQVSTTTVAQTVESAHSYTSNSDYTWTITAASGTTKMRVHFTQMQFEPNDYFYILDKNGTVIQQYNNSATTSDVWSSWVTGDTIKLRLVTNGYNNKWGFKMDKYDQQTAPVACSGVTLTLNPGGNTATSDANGLFSFSGIAAGAYTLTPLKTALTFSPASQSITLADGQIAALSSFTGQ